MRCPGRRLTKWDGEDKGGSRTLGNPGLPYLLKEKKINGKG